MYYVYILTNKTKSVLYVGVTDNIIRRVHEHKEKLIDGFTKRYNVDNLLYYETTNDVMAAIEREKLIKNMSRLKKENLIREKNPQWKDLYNEIIS